MVASDKRLHPRSGIELKVEYKKMNTFFADYTKNISKGGTFIKTDRPLPVGTRFLFKLSVPKLSEDLELQGEVIWTNQEAAVQRPDVAEFGMGIRFLFESEAIQQAFETQVETLMVEALGRDLYQKLTKTR